jgi:hypothetical protein
MLLRTFKSLSPEYQASVKTGLAMPGVLDMFLQSHQRLQQEYLQVPFPETLTAETLYSFYFELRRLRSEMQQLDELIQIIQTKL